MTYDEAIKRLDEIVRRLETEEALSMEDYKREAKEAKALIQFCEGQLKGMEQEMKETLQ